MSDLLVVNATRTETRVALIEGGQVVELFAERPEDRSVLGNVYKGRVTRVLPGLQASFVDIGLERGGFLHVSDIYGADKEEELEFYELDGEDEDDDEDIDAIMEEAERLAEEDGERLEGGPKGGNGKDVSRGPVARPIRTRKRGARKRAGRGPRRRRSGATRNISELIKQGQEIIVQVSKAPISTKGPRLTCHASLPGRYLVFMPTVDHVGVSRRISSEKERRRLRGLIEEMRPAGSGFIVRTVAEGVSDAAFRADMRFLINVWNEVGRQKESRPPAVLYTDLDVVMRVARDFLAASSAHMIIDSRSEYERIQRLMGQVMPELSTQLELYEGAEPIFDAYGIEVEIDNALARTVPLASGGSLVIEQTEALTVIDVNTGSFVGRGKSLEETITRANLEAVEEVAYQLRLRNIGGIVVIDLIDMERASNREKVLQALMGALQQDKARTNVLRMTELGLLQLTRKRNRDSLGNLLTEPCFYCDARGRIKRPVTVLNEILRDLERKSNDLPGLEITITCHEKVARLLRQGFDSVIVELEKKFQKGIKIQGSRTCHLEHFEIRGKKEGRKHKRRS